MGSKFGKLLSSLTIHRERTHRIALHGLPQFGATPPALLVRFAGEGNVGYERARRAVVEQLSTHPDSPNKAVLLRQKMAPVFAEHVVSGWEGIYEDDGAGGVKPAEFTATAAGELLSELAADADRADVFGLLYQALDPGNFRDRLPSPVDVGKE